MSNRLAWPTLALGIGILVSGGCAAKTWGPRVDVTGLKDQYAPQDVEPKTARPGGIDNLALQSTDTFTIPGKGDFTVKFSGYFRVARDNPTTNDWDSCAILVNIIDLRLHGRHEELGDVIVSLNPDILSTGQIFPTKGPGGPKACRIATGAIFDMPALGLSLFNKEPILLMNEDIQSIPPLNDFNGHALLFLLPLFDRANPNGEPMAYLTSLRYGAEDYISESEARSFRTRRR